MRIAALASVLLVASCWAAQADQRDPRLGSLFAQLEKADAVAARAIEARIWAIWGTIDDPEAQDLLERGSVAMANRDYAAAMTAFDALTARFPDFAEGWNRRATLFWILGDDEAALRDIRRTLALEPRHFGALASLGLVLLRLGREEQALRAFEAALRIHPNSAVARYHVAKLRELAREGAL
ncbi:MAG: tetratricopeptide repeat protein [Geminicoccaceae bacterium]|nr:tetratricopeptide repeat protein [Geminicoccaceae bacterium]MCX7630589.1 tetratricopeptide repeat protein [Geminicoccaceae bacterium]MDW8125446.1 tetratricopeptide repeat protein [Geminicoccaceae bacterium]